MAPLHRTQGLILHCTSCLRLALYLPESRTMCLGSIWAIGSSGIQTFTHTSSHASTHVPTHESTHASLSPALPLFLSLPLSSTSCACYLCTLSLVSGSQETGDLPSRQVVPEYPSGSEPACESLRVGTGALPSPNTELGARCGQGRCLVSPLLATAALGWLSKPHSRKPSRPSSNARFFLSTGFPQSRKLPYEDETVKST